MIVLIYINHLLRTCSSSTSYPSSFSPVLHELSSNILSYLTNTLPVPCTPCLNLTQHILENYLSTCRYTTDSRSVQSTGQAMYL